MQSTKQKKMLEKINKMFDGLDDDFLKTCLIHSYCEGAYTEQEFENYVKIYNEEMNDVIQQMKITNINEAVLTEEEKEKINRELISNNNVKNE